MDDELSELKEPLSSVVRDLIDGRPSLGIVYLPVAADHQISDGAMAAAAGHLACWQVRLQAWVSAIDATERRSLFPAASLWTSDPVRDTPVDRVVEALLGGTSDLIVCPHVEALSRRQWHTVVRALESRPMRVRGLSVPLLCDRPRPWIQCRCPTIDARAARYEFA